MGETHADLILTNLFNKKSASVRALVDTGATYLIVTPEAAKALGFDPEECQTRNAILADGTCASVPLLMGIQIEFEDRSCRIDAYVMGDECLLGFFALECMDLMVDPKGQRLVGVRPGGPRILCTGVRVDPRSPPLSSTGE